MARSMSGIMQTGTFGSHSATDRLGYAKEAIRLLLTEVLRKDDRISVCTFSREGKVVFPLLPVAQVTDDGAFFESVEAMSCGGGTVLSAGMDVGRKVLDNAPAIGEICEKRANRIMLLTDMREMGSKVLEEQIKKNAEEEVYLTIVALGVSFGSELTETVTKNKGSLYFSVTDGPELQDAIVENASSMFPVAFDVELTVQNGRVERVFGTPFDFKEVDRFVRWSPSEHEHFSLATRALASTVYLNSIFARRKLPFHLVAHIVSFAETSHRQSVMEVNTFFPCSLSDDGSIKGGLVLLEMTKNERAASTANTTIGLKYKDTKGYSFEQLDESIVTRPSMVAGFDADIDMKGPDMDNARMTKSLKKGILLQMYCELCRKGLLLTMTAPSVEEEIRFIRTGLEQIQGSCAKDFPKCEDMLSLSSSITSFVQNLERVLPPPPPGGANLS